MKKKFVQIVLLFLAMALFLSCPGAYAASSEDGAAGVGQKVMRIGIYYGSAGKQSITLSLVTGDGFAFGFYDDDKNFVQDGEDSFTESHRVTVSAASGVITVTDPATGEELYRGEGSVGIQPYSSSGEKTVAKCGYPYYGGFRFELFSSYGDLMTIVNMVELDDYVRGVAPYEMSASWPIEALKAQVVCARTYALAHAKATHQNAFHFDLCDTDDCQVYNGVYSGDNASRVDQAADETAGVVVTYHGSYCDTVYSSSNGGASESALNIWGNDVPYLLGKEDPYEATITIPNYNWTVTMTGSEIQAKLVKAGYAQCGVITAVTVKTFSDTGNVIALAFTDVNNKTYTIYRGSCRTVLSLRSMRYTVSSGNESAGDTSSSSIAVSGGGTVDVSGGVSVIDGSGKITTITDGYLITASGVESIGGTGSGSGTGTAGTTFTFTGTGWGHNGGLSQYGAYAMAKLGYTYRQILEFYYTGVTIG
jgi:stage II sporulation protein D